MYYKKLGKVVSFDIPFEKTEKEILTNDLIQQDIINGLRNDSHTTINIILIIVSVFLLFALVFLHCMRGLSYCSRLYF